MATKIKPRPAAAPSPEPQPAPVATYLPAVPLTNIAVVGNVRKAFDADALQELAASISAQGVLQPLVVRPHDSPTGPAYALVAGERRLRAATLAGLYAVPCVFHPAMTAAQAAEAQVVENLQRRDLDAIEEADGLQRLLLDHRWTQQGLAERLGRSQPWIANRLRLLRLPEEVREQISQGMLAPATAMAVIQLADRPELAKLAAEHLIDNAVPSSAADEQIDHWLCATCPMVTGDFGGHCDGDHSACPCRHAAPKGWSKNTVVCLDRERFEQVEAEARAAQPARAAKPDDRDRVLAAERQRRVSWEEEQREREAKAASATEALSAEVRSVADRPDLATVHMGLIAWRLLRKYQWRSDFDVVLADLGFECEGSARSQDDGVTRAWVETLDAGTLLRLAVTFAADPMPGSDLGATDWWRARCAAVDASVGDAVMAYMRKFNAKHPYSAQVVQDVVETTGLDRQAVHAALETAVGTGDLVRQDIGYRCAAQTPAEPAPPVESEALSWIRHTPSSDLNWQSSLKRLTDAELTLSLTEQHTKDARRRLQAEARRRKLAVPAPEPAAVEA